MSLPATLTLFIFASHAMSCFFRVLLFSSFPPVASSSSPARFLFRIEWHDFPTRHFISRFRYFRIWYALILLSFFSFTDNKIFDFLIKFDDTCLTYLFYSTSTLPSFSFEIYRESIISKMSPPPPQYNSLDFIWWSRFIWVSNIYICFYRFSQSYTSSAFSASFISYLSIYFMIHYYIYFTIYLYFHHFNIRLFIFFYIACSLVIHFFLFSRLSKMASHLRLSSFSSKVFLYIQLLISWRLTITNAYNANAALPSLRLCPFSVIYKSIYCLDIFRRFTRLIYCYRRFKMHTHTFFSDLIFRWRVFIFYRKRLLFIWYIFSIELFIFFFITSCLKSLSSIISLTTQFDFLFYRAPQVISISFLLQRSFSPCYLKATTSQNE